MNTEIIKKDGITIIALDGRLDTTNSPSFESTLLKCLDEEKINIKIDLSKLTYISSSGLRCFIMLLKNVQKSEGKLVLIGITPNIKEVFTMTGLDKLFIIE